MPSFHILSLSIKCSVAVYSKILMLQGTSALLRHFHGNQIWECIQAKFRSLIKFVAFSTFIDRTIAELAIRLHSITEISINLP